MSLFVPKEWKDRLAEFAGRRKLANVSTGEETTVDVSRAEGEVSQAGDAFSAANMNDLEQRIKDGFDKVDTNLGGFTPIIGETGEITGYKTTKGGADTVFPFSKKTKNGILAFGFHVNEGSYLSTKNVVSDKCSSESSGTEIKFSFLSEADNVAIEYFCRKYGSSNTGGYIKHYNSVTGETTTIDSASSSGSYTLSATKVIGHVNAGDYIILYGGGTQYIQQYICIFENAE